MVKLKILSLALVFMLSLFTNPWVLNTHAVDWWDANWGYRQLINISSSSNQTDYQLMIVQNFSTEYATGKINETCEDVRLTDENGSVVDFWIEECNLSISDNATMWVNSTYDYYNGTQLYLYYGHSTANTTSCGANTFEFFDNFTMTNITDKWAVTGAVTTTDGICQLDAAEKIDSLASFSINNTLRTKAKLHTTANGLYSLFGLANDGATGAGFTDLAAYRSVHATWDWAFINRKVSGELDPIDVSAYTDESIYQTFEFQWNATHTHNAINDTIRATHNNASRIPVIDLDIIADADATMYIDWLLIRKNIPVELVYLFGSEESAPPDSTPPNVIISTLSGTTTDTTPDITFTANDAIDTNMIYELLIDGIGYGTGYVANNTITTIQPNASLSIGTYNVYINATDDASNTGQSNTITLTISKTLVIYVYDEITLTRIPTTIEIFNTTDTKYYALGSRYKSGVLDSYDDITGNPEYACDMDTSNYVRYRFDAAESDEFYCYLPIPPTNNLQYNLTVTLDADAKLDVYLYNSDTLAYDHILTQTGAGVGHGTNYYLNFAVNNSAGKYKGEIKFLMTATAGTAYVGFFEVFPVNPEAIDALYLDFENVTSGTTTIRINAPEAWGIYSARDYYFYFTASSANTLNAYLLKDSLASSATYITLNSLESAIENVLITVNKYISGAYVEVSQKKTDGSGTALLLLDPTNTYQFVFTHSEYETLTKTLTPALSSYKIYLSQSTSINFTALYDDIYYNILPISPILDNCTAQAFNFTIISTNSSLEYQGMNITYNGTMYFSNHVTGSPAGSTINATLNIHNWTDTFTLTAYFKKSGYDEQIINKTYRVYRTDPQGYTIYEAIQNANNDIAGFGMFAFGIIAIILTAISIAIILPYSVPGSAIVGLVVLGTLTYINWFSWPLYFLVCLVTVSILYLQGDR